MRKKKFNFGPLFGESVEKNKSGVLLPSKEILNRANEWSEKSFLEPSKDGEKKGLSKWRITTIYIGFVFVFVTLFVRAFELQIIEGENFLGRAEDNRYKVRISHAPRGVIYDRDGQVLARNIPSFKVSIDPLSIPEGEISTVSHKVADVLKINSSKVKKQINEAEAGESIILNEDLDNNMALRLETEDIPGVEVIVKPKREYPHGAATAHILGYTSEVSQEELDNPRNTPHKIGDRVGRAGVEAEFEDILRGANGYDLMKVDSVGRKQGSLVTTEPLAGNDITLSIDIDLQLKVFKTLKRWLRISGSSAGSSVVMHPETGEVLALASFPSYDNNIFENGLTQKQYDRLVNDSSEPLLDRAMGSAYPPGSTFKLVTAAAGLESGNISPTTTIVDTGFVQLGDQVFNNWLWLDERRAEGAINVDRALARSNDTFFFRLSQRIGPEAIQATAKEFNLGSISGINLPSETAGLVPTEEWKLDTKGEVWYPGETLNLSIGQGDLLVSPMQLSLVTSAYANLGKIIKPTILKTNQAEEIRSGFLSDQTIETVRSGMYHNTVGDGNVSYLFSSFPVKSAGKTGTAESGQKRPHAWYTAFAPLNKPEIVVTVMAEHAGHGSEVSAPATKEIFEWYFDQK